MDIEVIEIKPGRRSVGPVLFTQHRQVNEYPGKAFHEVTVNRADEGDTNVVLSTNDGGPGAVALTPENARRLAAAIIAAADVIEGVTHACKTCVSRLGLENVGEDDYLHRPATDCTGCRAPQDHHDFEA